MSNYNGLPVSGRTQHYLRQQIEQASPAQQVVMLYDGAIRFTMQARECIVKKDIQGRHNANKRAMEVVSYLLEILDADKAGEVGARLQRIYAYLLRKFLDVDFRNDVAVCDDILEHLRTLREGWDQVAKAGVQPAAAPVEAGQPSDAGAATAGAGAATVAVSGTKLAAFAAGGKEEQPPVVPRLNAVA